ncbi:unnamed protein product [Moneuplotes crassus]|uniref:Uncharacterized protein n=1 Tax=Euplotes crassus TaxID=5936 RepID=A0AAD1XTU8_EUPCR|nr:unnamed protein product [Moneuplotes crassus]
METLTEQQLEAMRQQQEKEKLEVRSEEIGATRPQSSSTQETEPKEVEVLEQVQKNEPTFLKRNYVKECALCNQLPCCPEHCCDWDSCNCKSCPECIIRNQTKEVGVSLPIKIIKKSAIIKAPVKKPKPKKAKKHIRIGPEPKEGTSDSLLITNFEVEEQKKTFDVRKGVKIYGTGVKGLQALRTYREEEVEEEPTEIKRKKIKIRAGKFKKAE